MSDLVNRLVQQFKSKSQYDHFIRDSQGKFDINSYRFQHMTQAMVKKGYNQLSSKYKKKVFEVAPRAWQQNQRKLFVWFLLALLKQLKENNHKLEQYHWEELSQIFFNKDILFLKYQYNVTQKNRKRHEWTQTQDQIMKSCEEQIQRTNWNQIAKQIYFRTKGKNFKSPKQCRQRWQNHLDNRINKQKWQAHEDLLILKYVLQKGKKWCKIVQQLKNTRTQHMVKNRFKSILIKGQAGLKDQDKKTRSQKQIIQRLISDFGGKLHLSDKWFELQNVSEAKDRVEGEGLPEIRLNAPKKSNELGFGCLERDQNGEFVQSFTTRQSQVSQIFKSRSPVNLALSSSFAYSGTIMTPTADGGFPYNNFFNYEQKQNKILKKSSNLSEMSNTTNKYMDCSRKQDNLKFSFQLNALQNGQKVGITTPIVQFMENYLFGNNDKNFFGPLQKSQFYTSTLNSSISQRQMLHKSQMQQKCQKK